MSLYSSAAPRSVCTKKRLAGGAWLKGVPTMAPTASLANISRPTACNRSTKPGPPSEATDDRITATTAAATTCREAAPRARPRNMASTIAGT